MPPRLETSTPDDLERIATRIGTSGPTPEHNHTSPAQDIARLVYWIRFWEATGATVPTACKTEVAAAVARWPLQGGS